MAPIGCEVLPGKAYGSNVGGGGCTVVPKVADGEGISTGEPWGYTRCADAKPAVSKQMLTVMEEIEITGRGIVTGRSSTISSEAPTDVWP
jgi:hypothetical protein